MHWTDKLTPAQKTVYFEQIRKKVKKPGFSGNSELARKAANKRWHKSEIPQEEEPQAIS